MSLLNYNDFLIKESVNFEYVLYEGGAYGHIMHPFEDMSLTMGDIQKMIQMTVNGLFTEDNFVQYMNITTNKV